MRKIKFRVWSLKNSHWVTLTALDLEGRVCIGSSEPDDFVTQQFTGVLDRNNKEIYEGDLVRVFNSDGEDYHKQTSEVFYSSRWAQFELKMTGNSLAYYLVQYGSLEVVGNVFENPELLK